MEDIYLFILNHNFKLILKDGNSKSGVGVGGGGGGGNQMPLPLQTWTLWNFFFNVAILTNHTTAVVKPVERSNGQSWPT